MTTTHLRVDGQVKETFAAFCKGDGRNMTATATIVLREWLKTQGVQVDATSDAQKTA